MNLHSNARTDAAQSSRVGAAGAGGQPPKAVATAFGVDVKTVSKWVDRFQAEGPAGLEDRSSRPHRLHEPTPPETCEQVIALRRQRWTGKQIAKETARLAGHGEPLPAPRLAQPDAGPGAARAGGPLRVRKRPAD